MDATLHALGGLLLKAVPTFILFLLLHFYLKAVFFGPLQEVLRKRRDATEGAREAAEASLKKALDRATEYEARLRDARAAIYHEQEELRKQWVQEQTRHIEEARAKSHELVQIAKHQIEQDVAAAKRDLTITADDLAEHIAISLVERRAS
jgi:F-type H+-transporting ATPase subunit b